jgi:hypothetical protein
MDYAEVMRAEARGAHAVFHQFALARSADATALFFFFEGEEDPTFYMPHILARISERRHHVFICYGRSEVLKTHSLVERDGRGTLLTLFFVDKDHTDLVSPGSETLPSSVFQTDCYSIENYLACESVFRRFWIERLHLSDLDPRYQSCLGSLQRVMSSFEARCRVLMALILLGRGIDGAVPIKLNLNNVQLEKIFSVAADPGVCRYRAGALRHFFGATGLGAHPPKHCGARIRAVVRKYLRDKPPKTYVRGKYDLWVFAKSLAYFSRQLSDRETARRTGLPRATPTVPFTIDSATDSLAALASCPPALAAFLDRTLAT